LHQYVVHDVVDDLVPISDPNILSEYLSEYWQRKKGSRNWAMGCQSGNCPRHFTAVYWINGMILPHLRQPPLIKDDPYLIYFMANHGTSVVVETNF